MEKEINKILDACYDRREMGAKKYGKEGWKNRNMFTDMKEELYDVINYAIFQILKTPKSKDYLKVEFYSIINDALYQILKIDELEEEMTSLDSIIDDILSEDEDCPYCN